MKKLSLPLSLSLVVLIAAAGLLIACEKGVSTQTASSTEKLTIVSAGQPFNEPPPPATIGYGSSPATHPSGRAPMAAAPRRVGSPALAIIQSDGQQAQLGRSQNAQWQFFYDSYDTSHFNTEAYDKIEDNDFLEVASAPLSTFSIDVDTAAYANTRRMLRANQRPPAGAVRIEELINYFNYDYATPDNLDQPFAVHTALADCPWAEGHQLLRIGLKGWEKEYEELPPSNLVFLMDVSGSMNSADKLPLLQKSLKMLTHKLGEKDRVSIVVYAGASGLVLDSTAVNGPGKKTIIDSLERLKAGGSTQGSAGIQLAYEVAEKNFIEEGNNRVILATDGDFNVGITNQSDLVDLIKEKAKSGVFLSVLGFGTGNLKDSTMEQLANKGNGNYSYIDSVLEAEKVLIEEMGSTLLTIAKDVKIQVEFNPLKVGAYRLIGYENRMLQTRDFNDDKKDAGEIGAGHTVTALYELVPAGMEVPDGGSVDDLKYQKAKEVTDAAQSDEMLTVKLRYKQPDGDTSKLLEVAVKADRTKSDNEMQFASAVAAWGMLLRDSPHKGTADYDMVLDLARAGKGADPEGYRGEFIQLVKLSRTLEAK